MRTPWVATGGRRIGSGGALAVVALAVGTSMFLATLGSRPAEPPIGDSLVPFPLHGNDWTLPGGGLATDGMEVLQLQDGRSPVTITDVRLVGARGVELVGARVTGPHRATYQFDGEHGFPGHDGAHSTPAVGTRITAAKRGWGLLVGLRVASSGYPMIQGVEVRYRVDRGISHQVYRQVFRGGVIFCADDPPRHGYDCRPPAGLEKLVGND